MRTTINPIAGGAREYSYSDLIGPIPIWNQDTTGNAATATKLATSRTLTVGNTGKAFDGTGNVSWSLVEIGAAPVVHTHGYGDLTGTVPTWNQNTTGNAATATTLQTARTINGTSFNGSANIATANWGTARTITIGATGKTVNGSGNVSWTLAEIGVQPSDSPTFGGTATFNGWGNSHFNFGASHDVILTYGSTGKLVARTYDGTSYSPQYDIWHGGNQLALGTTVASARTAMGLGTAALINRDQNATPNTVPERTSAGDILVRLVRSNYANQSAMSGAIAYRINNGTDDYIRFCDSPAAARGWLGAAPITDPVFDSGISFGSGVVASPTDVTRHLGMFGTQYGMTITNLSQNYVVPANAGHYFYNGTGISLSVTTTGIETAGTVKDSLGNVRKVAAAIGNANITADATWLNWAIEKSGTANYTYTIPSGLGTHGDAITIVNAATAGTITIARGSGVEIYRNGTNANIVVQPGSIVTLFRSSITNRWIA